MRKYFLILKAFYKNILIPATLLLLITLISELLLVSLVGTYRYYTLTDRLFEDLMEDNDSLHVARFTLAAPEEPFYADLRNRNAVKELYRYQSIVNREVTYHNQKIKVLFTDTELLRDYALLHGKSFYSETGMNDGIPQGIFVGDAIDTNGSEQTVQFISSNDSFSVSLIGNVISPYYIPDLTVSSTEITSYDIMQKCNNTLIIKDSPETRAFFSEKGLVITGSGVSFLVVFHSSAAESEKQEVRDFLDANNFYCTDTETILENSRQVTADTLQHAMPLPFYLALLSAILTLCFSILFLHRKMDLILTFYLCGCSKRKGYQIMAFSLGMIGALALLASILIVSIRQQGLSVSGNTGQFLLDDTVYIFLICYGLLLLFLSVFASFLIYRRKSCVSVRRKVEL